MGSKIQNVCFSPKRKNTELLIDTHTHTHTHTHLYIHIYMHIQSCISASEFGYALIFSIITVITVCRDSEVESDFRREDREDTGDGNL